MLKRLRKKFVIIVMALVGTVLVAVLGSTYISTYQTQQDLIDYALDRSIHRGTEARITIGYSQDATETRIEGRPQDGRAPVKGERSDMGGMGEMLGLVIDIDDEGIVLQISDAPVVVNTEVMNEVIELVVSGDKTSGRDTDTHLAWSSTALNGGGWRIAIVDTTSSEALLSELAASDAKIIVVALVVLFAITWWLSDWALKPVAAAWEQQRRFVADASHELKTPLAVISANTQILQKHDGVSEDAMRWVESTADEVEQMQELVGDLLQLARADETAAGVSTNAMRHEDIDLSELVESAALEFDAVAFERGCLLDAQVADGVHVTGDPEWIDHLTRILIDNACKYGEDGSTVTVALGKASGHPTLSVHNQGNAIDPEDLPHVFERFYRSDKARSREGEGGFGLGLAIAKGIADAHGGEISVTSTEREGTTFKVVFP